MALRGGSWAKLAPVVVLVAVMTMPTGALTSPSHVFPNASVVVRPSESRTVARSTGLTSAPLSACSNCVVGNITVGTIPVTGGVLSLAYDAGRGEIFVGTYDGNVSVISDVSHSVVDTIGTGGYPDGLAYDKGKGEVFVADENNVTVISDVSNTIVARVNVQSDPRGVAYDSGLGEVFISNVGSNSVSVINDTTNRVVTNISVPYACWPYNDVYDAGKGEVFVAGWGCKSHDVSVISDSTNTVVAKVNAGDGGAMAYDGVKGEVFAVNSTDIDVISDATDSVVARVTEPGAAGVTYDSSDRVVFSYGAGETNAISDSTNSVNGSVSAGNGGALAFDEGTGEVFVGGAPTSLDYVEYFSNQLGMNASASTISGPAWLGVNFSASAWGASWSYAWSWTFGDGGTSTLQNPSHTYTKPGSYQANVTVTDSSGAKATRMVTVTVGNPLPFYMTQSRSSDDVGQPDWFNSSTSGNVGSLTYSYGYPSIAGCGSSSGPTIRCIPTTTGNFTVHLNVTDPYGNKWSLVSDTVRVYPALQVNLSLSSPTPLLAQTVAITSNASGGNPAYNYSYLGLPYGCYSENKPTIGCLPTQADWYNITVAVTDRSNNTVRATVSMHVIFDFNVVVPSSSPVGKQLTIMVNTNQTFNGSTLTTYHVSFTESGIPNNTTWSVTVNGVPETATVKNSSGTSIGFSEPNGTYTYTIGSVSGYAASPSSGSITVAGAAQSLPIAFTKAALLALPGQMGPAGGYGTFSYSYSGLPPGCTSEDVAVLTCTPTQAGKYVVTVSVHDSAGDHQAHSVIVNILAAQPSSGLPPGLLGMSGYEGYYLLGGSAAVVLALVVVVLRRRRVSSRKARTQETDEPTEGTGVQSSKEKAPEVTTDVAKPVAVPEPQQPTSVTETEIGPSAVSTESVVASPPPKEPSLPTTTTAPFGTDTKACIICGKDIPSRAKFCPHCKESQA